jgi:hypothetical protein
MLKNIFKKKYDNILCHHFCKIFHREVSYAGCTIFAASTLGGHDTNAHAHRTHRTTTSSATSTNSGAPTSIRLLSFIFFKFWITV